LAAAPKKNHHYYTVALFFAEWRVHKGSNYQSELQCSQHFTRGSLRVLAEATGSLKRLAARFFMPYPGTLTSKRKLFRRLDWLDRRPHWHAVRVIAAGVAKAH
jgi:hypothetical protein